MEKKKINKFIGAHCSTVGGVQNAPINAAKIGAKAFAMFLKNQRRWEAKPYGEKEIGEFRKNIQELGYDPKYILPHDGYLINLGNADPEKREKSLNAFIDEMERVRQLGLICINTHPGSHLGEISEEESLKLVAECFNQAMKKVPEVKIIIENTAGQGTNLGYTFGQIGDIIALVEDKERIGVCIDTCHTLTSGYELKDEVGYEKTMSEFQEKIGFRYLAGVHLNDSKFDTGSRKDRHDSIGKGVLGEEFFKRFMNDSRFDNIPIILETIDETIWEDEIKYLYSLID
ncbi:MAG: deoxyribonuclease IV [Fusobacteriaceae bacterium]